MFNLTVANAFGMRASLCTPNDCRIDSECTIIIPQRWLSVRAFLPKREVLGFIYKPCHIKDILKMEPDASLLSAQHKILGLVSLHLE